MKKSNITVASEVFKNYTKKAQDKLTERERDIIERYYGYGDNYRHSLDELGTFYNVTRERIRQIKTEGLKKLGVK